MRTQKVYIPIRLCLVVLLAIRFLALRTDPPDEPILIVKPVEPLLKSTSTAPVSETWQGGQAFDFMDYLEE